MWIIFDVAIGMYNKKNTVNKKNFTRTSRFFSASWRNMSSLCQLLYSLRFTVGQTFLVTQSLSQLKEVAAACEFQGCLQNQSKVCLDIIWITRISAVLGPFRCWKAILMDVDKCVLSSSLGLVMRVLLAEVTGATKWVVEQEIWDTSCQTSATLGSPHHLHSTFGLSLPHRKSNETSCGCCCSHSFALW